MKETIAWAEATTARAGLSPGDLIELAHTLPEGVRCAPFTIRSDNRNISAHGYVSAAAWGVHEEEITQCYQNMFSRWNDKHQNELIGTLKNGLRIVLSFDTHPEHLKAIEHAESW